MIRASALLIAGLVAGLAGCRAANWYDSTRTMAEEHCRRQPPAEYERCMGNVNRQPYADYEKARHPEPARAVPAAAPAGDAAASVVLRKAEPLPPISAP